MRSRLWSTPRTTISVGRSRKSVSKRGSSILPDEQLALLLHVLDGVAGEALERLADLLAALLGELADRLGVLDVAVRDDLVAAQDLAARARRSGRRRRDRSNSGAPGDVDQVDAGLDQQQRAHVRVVAARGARAVDHRLDAAGDEVLARHAVEIVVVDDRHVARTQALDEMLGALAEPGDPRDLDRAALRRRVAVGGRDGHGGDSTDAPRPARARAARAARAPRACARRGRRRARRRAPRDGRARRDR